MYQGETITTAISDLPVSVSDIRSLSIIFHTLTKVILEKSIEECRIDGEVIECTLTQDETLRFPCGPIIRTVAVLTKDGARFEIHNDEMIVGKTAKGGVLN